MIDLSRETELIKHVFSNDKGRELLALWDNVFTRRSSFQPDSTPEQTAFSEGTRMFYQTIRNIFDAEVKK